METLPAVLIVELGSQYTLLIERTLREIGARSVILGPARATSWLKKNPVKAVILSGGEASVYDRNAPQPPEGILSLRQKNGQPIAVLGICYGMQWVAHHLGGNVRFVHHHGEYGPTDIRLADEDHPLFRDTPLDQEVWMSHGDSVIEMPKNFTALAHTGSKTIAAMANGSLWGVQFHPEVTHTPNGKTILKNFLKFAGCDSDWRPKLVVAEIQKRALGGLGDRKAVFGFSGGVDSTTLSAILSPVLGDRLQCITIDGGHLREGELEEIAAHAGHAKVNLRIFDAREQFGGAMMGTTDAEEKRRRFKKAYTALFMRAAKDFGAGAVIQGTLAPDRIESGATGGALIKSHHNVGLDMGGLIQLHPIDHLFKYEVRALAQEIGLPASVSHRQPFPGPGLFLRVLGVPATRETLEVARWADARVQEILKKRGLYLDLSQLVVAYHGFPIVGVKGDRRTYEGAVVVRAVKTTDFMTAEGVWFPEAAVKEICSALTRHPKIVRAWFDPTDKPPATTEFE